MKILYLTNYFPPEIGTGPHLPFELGESLVAAGHEVTIVTGFPRYNLPVMPERYHGRLLFREALGGMRVLRIMRFINYNINKSCTGKFLM